MATDPNKYTSSEISAATGIKRTIVQYRGRATGIKFPCTYDQVKQIIGYRAKGPGRMQPRKAVIDRLKVQLKNDGFKVVMDK